MLAVALPLGALAWVERRSDRLRALLGLEDPGLKAKVPDRRLARRDPAAPLGRTGAAGDPVHGRAQRRTDAELYYVFDVSRSMSAAPSPESPRRFDQALETAERIHQRLANIPSGVATMTDRVVRASSRQETARSDRDARRRAPCRTAAPARVRRRRHRLRLARHACERHVLQPGDEAPGRDRADGRRVASVRLRPAAGGAGRRRADGLRRGPPVEQARPRLAGRLGGQGLPAADSSAARTAQLARATNGKEASPGDIDRVVRTVRSAVGSGPEVDSGQLLRVISLGKWFALLSLVPLGYLLWRRNLS